MRRVLVSDRMQRGCVYHCSEPTGKHFDPGFEPELTPKQMLALGVFGGKYMTDCAAEFPADWFTKAKLCSERHDPALNCFGVNASQPLSVWREKGWIHADDPRGWLQWYCRYFLGRRGADDERQIKRWRAVRRHRAQILKNCRPGDLDCRRKQNWSGVLDPNGRASATLNLTPLAPGALTGTSLHLHAVTLNPASPSGFGSFSNVLTLRF